MLAQTSYCRCGYRYISNIFESNERNITNKTKVIMPVHLYEIPNLENSNIANKFKLKVINDSAGFGYKI